MDMENQNELQVSLVVDESIKDAYVGPKALLYRAKFTRLRTRGTVFGWNWAAFFFGPLWFAYRRMYPYAIIYLCLNMLLVILPASPLWMFANVFVLCFAAACADALYMKRIDQLAAHGATLDEQTRSMDVLARGGVRVSGVLVIVLLTFVFSSILTGLMLSSGALTMQPSATSSGIF